MNEKSDRGANIAIEKGAAVAAERVLPTRGGVVLLRALAVVVDQSVDVSAEIGNQRPLPAVLGGMPVPNILFVVRDTGLTQRFFLDLNVWNSLDGGKNLLMEVIEKTNLHCRSLEDCVFFITSTWNYAKYCMRRDVFQVEEGVVVKFWGKSSGTWYSSHVE